MNLYGANKTPMKNLRRGIFLFLVCLAGGGQVAAQNTTRAVRISGDVLVVAIPAAAFATTLALKDYTGTKQLVLGGAVSLSATYLLKLAVDKRRRDGSNNNSFPSAHSSVSFQAASFLQQRYGWKAGIPAYALSTYVAWSRIYAKKHDIWDVAAGMAIGVGSSYIFTRPWGRKHQLVLSPTLDHNDAPGLYASFKF